MCPRTLGKVMMALPVLVAAFGRPEPAAAAPAFFSLRWHLTQVGLQQLGRPYDFGAELSHHLCGRAGVIPPPPRAFDCSAFTQYVYNCRSSIPIPRSSYQQAVANVGVRIPWQHSVQSDLVFFQTSDRAPITHVAMRYSPGQLLHTFGAGGVHVGGYTSFWQSHSRLARRYAWS